MPCATLHCMVHLTPSASLLTRFPAVYSIRHSLPSDPSHYSLWAMMLWATVPYLIWQFSYHFGITVRRRQKIAEGRPTSFTWLRKSYSTTTLGRVVLTLPESLQEPAFMFIQYSYALFTMLPCPLWLRYRWPAAAFLMAVFVWSVYNGATFYIDVFGNRFQKELETLRKEVAKLQESPSLEEDGMLTPALRREGNEFPGMTAMVEGLEVMQAKEKE